jgi:glycosyltransferase involved in cell wall biosynthesis
MRILGIVPAMYDFTPGQRFRIEQWEPILNEKGIYIDYSPFLRKKYNISFYKDGNYVSKFFQIFHSLLNRFEDVKKTPKYDLVYIFREAALIGPAFFERLIKATKVPIVFDFDDSIFLPRISSFHSRFIFLKSPKKVDTICRLSDHVIAGNSFLAEYASRFNSRVSVIPTTIDTDKYKPQSDKPHSDVLTIGWSGSFSTVKDLDILREVLQEFAKQENFRLRVIGTSDYKIGGVNVESIPWRAETEIADLRAIDIGIMPLPDDDWSKGKCGLKALQYMALGIPTICSPVGVNSEIIQDGKNGFLANTKPEWLRKLSLLLNSRQLRMKLGNAGRQTVEDKYSAKVQAPRISEIFQVLVNKQTRRK